MSLALLTVRDEILFFLSRKLFLLKMYHRQRGKTEKQDLASDFRFTLGAQVNLF